MNLAKETKFENFGFTCPNCDTYYSVYHGQVPISEEKYNTLRRVTEAQVKKGYCKHCHRKDPKIPTTLEMDGIFTKEDIDERNKVMLQCRDCSKWTIQDTESMAKGHLSVCANCHSLNFDSTSLISKRSWNPLAKRKVKKKK